MRVIIATILREAFYFSVLYTTPTFETVRCECSELVAVHLELCERQWQRWDPGELVAIQVKFLQKGQVLHDTQPKRKETRKRERDGFKGQGDKTDKNGHFFWKSVISHPSRQAGHNHSWQKYTKWENVRSEHLLHVIYHVVFLVKLLSVAPQWKLLRSVCVCQVKAVDGIFCRILRARPSVLCHYRDARRKLLRKREKKRKSLKIISLLFSTSLAAAVFRQVCPSQYRERMSMVVCNDWSECGGLPPCGQGLCHLEVRPGVILRED